MSDAGKANVISAAAGKTLEEDSKFVLLYEVSVSFLWAYNKMLDNGNRWSVGLGYDYRISASLSKLSFDDPADPNQVAFSDVSVGYIQHGPVANFYYVF